MKKNLLGHLKLVSFSEPRTILPITYNAFRIVGRIQREAHSGRVSFLHLFVLLLPLPSFLHIYSSSLGNERKQEESGGDVQGCVSIL